MMRQRPIEIKAERIRRASLQAPVPAALSIVSFAMAMAIQRA